MMKPMALAALLLITLLPALSTACGGDDGAESTPLPSGVTPAPTAGENAGPLQELAAKFLGGVDGKFVYRYTGPLAEFSESTLTVYRLGQLDRHDHKTSADGFERGTITAFSGSDYFVCTEAAAFKQCLPATLGQIGGLRVYEVPVMDVPPALVGNPDLFDVTQLADETFAGKSGRCFQASSAERITNGPPGTEEIKACFTEQGGLLYLKRSITLTGRNESEQPYIIEAQELGEAVPTDFEPIVPFQ